MSDKSTSWIWDHSRQKHSHKLVLLAIARYTDQDGRARPPVSHLGRLTGLPESRVRHILIGLQKSGELAFDGRGPNGTNIYRVVFN